MPTHIIASMIGQVLCMCKDYFATHVLTSCYLPGHKCFGCCQLGGVLFLSYNLRFPMGGVNGLWAISPGLSVTSTREVKGQVKGQGSEAYTL